MKIYQELDVKPRKYQDDGIKWCIDKELNSESRGGLLADEVGLGKTYQMIGLILANECNKTLICVPKSLIDQWYNEITKMTNKIHVIKIRNLKTEMINFKKDCLNVVILGISQIYERNKNHYNKTVIHKINWDRFIIDEAHIIKNNKSKLHNACKEVSTTYKWLLTATPVMNTMKDFVNLMGYFDISKSECQNHKREVVERMILRRSKEEVKIYNKDFELPECNVELYEIPFETKDEKTMYTKIFAEMKKEIKKENVMEALERLLRVRQICIHPQIYLDGIAKKNKEDKIKYIGNCTKLNALIKLIKKKPINEKAIIFCQFISEINLYKKELEKNGYECCYMNGTMDIEQRTNIINEFKINPTLNIILMQINVGGVGLNLQEANWIYITSPTWNPCVEYQAIGRCHRSGQKKPVNVVKMIINDNDDISYIEKSIVELQHKKNVVINDLLGKKV